MDRPPRTPAMLATLWLKAWAAVHRARLWFPVGWDRYR